MSWFGKSKYEKFIEQNADALVQNLAHYSALSAKEINDALGEQMPPNLNVDAIFLFIFSLRGTIDALAVKNRFGDRAHNRVVHALDKIYQVSFRKAWTDTGQFSQSLMRDVKISISESSDPADWIRIHSIRTLETRDPEDELFHVALASAFTKGESIVETVERAA
jgi:hypothetical protein